jgi:Fur family ferric uptake transcriptional regulator
LLLRSLFASPRHRTAENLAAEMQVEDPAVHISTVYRNLEELERLGVVTHVHLGPGPATYHLAQATHSHLVCEECGTVIEVGDQLFASLGAVTLGEYGFTIDPTTSRCGGAAATVGGTRPRARGRPGTHPCLATNSASPGG